VFASDDWSLLFPDHNLSALASECSDHAPLLLRTDCALPHFKRFRFENFWPKCGGFLETVAQAWSTPLPWSQADAFRTLDFKLRATAKALTSWSAKHVGSVRLQLAIAKEIVLRFDCAQDRRELATHELALRHKAKLCSLGLASLQRTIYRQRSRITYLVEGDANTKFFHLQACHRSRKSYIGKIRVQDVELSQDEDKAEAFFQHFDDIFAHHEIGLRKLICHYAQTVFSWGYANIIASVKRRFGKIYILRSQPTSLQTQMGLQVLSFTPLGQALRGTS